MFLEKSITIEMAHRLPNHQGKCANIHGHSWVIKVAVNGVVRKDHKNHSDGMVVDLNLLKSALLMVDALFDHTLTLADYDDSLIASLCPGNKIQAQGVEHPWGRQITTKFGRINILRDAAPTSENMAMIWKDMLVDSLPGVHVATVSVKETDTSEAIWISEEEE